MSTTLLPPGTFNFRYLLRREVARKANEHVKNRRRGYVEGPVSRLIVQDDSRRGRRARESQLSSVRRYTEKLSAAGCELSLAPAIDRRPTDLGQGVAVWTGIGASRLRERRARVWVRAPLPALHTPARGRAAAHTDVARVVTRNFTLSGETLK